MMKAIRYCLTLDLKDDASIIEVYEHYHRSDVIWPEIIEGIKDCNIIGMGIYRVANRLFMVLETNESFDLERDFNRMRTLPKQKEWADLMCTFQQAPPFSLQSETWVLMDQIFDLNTKKDNSDQK